jgi:hypothetical protein
MSDMTSVLHQSVSINTKGGYFLLLGIVSLMSTLEESLVANFDSTKVWVMDQVCLMDNGMSFDIFAGKTILYG